MTIVKSAGLAGLLVLGAFAANAQTYWSPNANLNCGNYGDKNGAPTKITTPNGVTGYSCFIYGTLPWYAAGEIWSSSIRVSAPPTGAVAIFLTFVDENGLDTKLDHTYEGDSKVYSETSASQALFANQPLVVNILGAPADAPSYRNTASGPVSVLAYCPDADTCSQIQAQLIYSALPSHPWSLSVPVVWDWQTSHGWSSVGVDDGATNIVSFVVYNLANDLLAHTYKLNVYDSAGNLYSSGPIPSVAYLGSYANVLGNIVPSLPAGAFKLQLVGPDYSAFEALQFTGPSATNLISASEMVAPGAVTNKSGVNKGRRLVPSGQQLLPPHSSSDR